VVRIVQVGKPAPGDRELLVKVHATTVNRTDCHYRSGKPWIMRPLVSGLARPRAAVLGNEFAGQVAAAGNGVTSFRVGDRVFGYTEGPFGAHAEYLVIAENGRVAVIPPNLDYEQAAPCTEGAHYALGIRT
jgi:NADPH:quinone reductase-like Zn-dependent oxidoreductase